MGATRWAERYDAVWAFQRLLSAATREFVLAC